MADESVDAFPTLETVYRVTGYKFNQLSRKLPDAKLNSEQTGESKVIPMPWCSPNSSSNAWSQPNLIQKLKKRGYSGSGLKSNNLQVKSNSPKPLNGSENGVLDDNRLLHCVEDDTAPSKDCKDGQCDDEGISKPNCENNDDEGIPKPNCEKNDDEGMPKPNCENIEDEGIPKPNCENIDDEGIPKPQCENADDEIVDSDTDIVFDSDDDLSLDDTDSDTGEKSHEGSKKSKWFRKFFNDLNKLTVEEISSPATRWHCPACQDGPGAIDWYHGLQPLLNHSRTIKVRRARLHRAFSETLEEECSMRGAPLIRGGEANGLWEGLDNKVKDREIVWPPMVVIMNTKYEQDENNKWTGMGNQELLDCFSDYGALKARHSYGPHGHRGMSVLIFEPSVAGYLESVQLYKHFKEQGRDREAWDRCKNPFVPGGKRQLYGYMASREDLDVFNKHSGKSKLKFEIRSYQEMVESKIKHINDDSKVSEKLRKTTEENHVVQERTKEHHLQNKEEMNEQEKFFLDQIQIIHQSIAAKEDEFTKSQQAKQEVMCVNGDSSVKEDDNHIMEKNSSFTKSQDKDMRQFEAVRDNILKTHGEKQLALKKKQWQEQVELEKELENELTQLMNKHALSHSQEESC
ncbi:putative XS domain-containing protein [Medicago truncatula]|uniref:Putative XS domain-containing protein n=1 Tax=Medicago truncatula TaxID=3880 RepID=G7IK02_MEDTR|nr:protein SUPPRESSOR OF GENE SILENCING 3 [Medicago truncatula]XP_024633337.1 protein SUPPRESSOR OF GENE SILENCING 3 [Medicago truncatula]AES63340.1 XS domain protein/XS zinc finger protein [Medicago truncatula]RHN71571.1 putative XS domain-containing protein [Medicago truncatula]